MAVFTLGREERLKSRKQLQILFKQGRSFVQVPYRVYYMPVVESTDQSVLKFGVGVSARHFKRATDRNRMKRLIRESWRLQKSPLTALLKERNHYWNIFIIYTGKELTNFATVQEATAAVIKKLEQIMEKRTS